MKYKKLLSTIVCFLCCLFFGEISLQATQNVTLAWNPSTDSTVAGYKIYYGSASGNYTNVVDVGNVTNATISGLVEGVTYYFAATCYNSSGIQSPFSNEVSYTVPNLCPTINSVSNIFINENAGQQVVNLSGITGGFGTYSTITITASSGNTNLIPNITVIYTSPNTNGTLVFTPLTYAYGVITNTVTVKTDKTNTNYNTTATSFIITISAVNQWPTLTLPITNLTINENNGSTNVSFSNVTSGAPNESQILTVTNSSSNTNLIPNPIVNYTNPFTIGSLTLTPKTNISGLSTIFVTVNDGGITNNATTNKFTTTVLPLPPPNFHIISATQ